MAGFVDLGLFRCREFVFISSFLKEDNSAIGVFNPLERADQLRELKCGSDPLALLEAICRCQGQLAVLASGKQGSAGGNGSGSQTGQPFAGGASGRSADALAVQPAASPQSEDANRKANTEVQGYANEQEAGDLSAEILALPLG